MYCKHHREVFLEINLNQKTLKLIPLECTERTSVDRLSESVLRNTPENQRFSDVFRGHRKRPLP